MSLFDIQSTGLTNGHKHLVEMRAGKMYQAGKWVNPDKRKGLLFVYQNAENLMHFCWKDRVTNRIEDDLIIFPGDCTYSHVSQCKTGRVYLLKFTRTPLRKFYWLQEPKADKDDSHCQIINSILNNPPPQTTTISIPPELLANLNFDDFTPAQLIRMFENNQDTLLSILNTNNSNNENNNDFEYSNENNAENSQNNQIEDPPSRHNTTPISSTGNLQRKSSLKSENDEDSNKEKSKKKKNVSIVDDLYEDDEDENDDEETKK